MFPPELDGDGVQLMAAMFSCLSLTGQCVVWCHPSDYYFLNEPETVLYVCSVSIAKFVVLHRYLALLDNYEASPERLILSSVKLLPCTHTCMYSLYYTRKNSHHEVK